MAASSTALIRGWLSEHFPHQPHASMGVSGAALLCAALRQQPRSTVVLPAFICPTLSAMARFAGKKVLHLDAADGALHPDPERVHECLSGRPDSDTVLLIDHSFGYPFPGVSDLRRRYPRLLIIEDCVRALGAVAEGEHVGRYADWVLLSMYKTVPGSRNGAILLTNTPLPVESGDQVGASVRERAATIGVFRAVYERLKRRSPGFGPSPRGVQSAPWEPVNGLPSELCLSRFARHLLNHEREIRTRLGFAEDLAAGLSGIRGLRLVMPAARCRTSGHYLSFQVMNGVSRDELLSRLHRRGLFLLRTWDLIPPHFGSLSGTFPSGASNSLFLADHVAHIPVDAFRTAERRRRLLESLRELAEPAP